MSLLSIPIKMSLNKNSASCEKRLAGMEMLKKKTSKQSTDDIAGEARDLDAQRAKAEWGYFARAVLAS
jgi:hypothetical protein